MAPDAHDDVDDSPAVDSGPIGASDPSAESEDDLSAGSAGLSEAVVTATDWTVETVLSQLRRGHITLNPRFQRRDAWRRTHKSRYIESLFLGLPIPQLVLAERTRGAYIVIDGKQRLLALRQFAADANDDFDEFRLSGLDVLTELNGKTFNELQADPAMHMRVAAFENQTIRTMVVRNWPDDDFLYRVFLRLNTGSVPLAPQELRQALLPGAFVDFAEDFSADSGAIQQTLGLHRPDFRMRDVELLIRYFAFALYLEDYAGNLKAFLDLTCARLNGRWEESSEEIKAAADECDAALNATREIFKEGAFRRWDQEGWERRFNRAVFDVMVFYFRLPAVRAHALEKSEAVVAAFRGVSEDDVFQEALQTTTKSITATHTRLAVWGDALQNALQEPLPIPALEDGRITVPQ